MEKKVIALVASIINAIIFAIVAWLITGITDDVEIFAPDIFPEVKPRLQFAALASLAGSIALPSLAGIDTLKELQRRKVEIENLQREVRDMKDNQGYYEWQPEDLK